MSSIILPSKRCLRCGKDKPIDEFFNSSRYGDGHRKWCKVCDKECTESWRKNNREKFNEYTRNWRHDNPEKAKFLERKYDLKKYGISPGDYDKMYKEQNGECAICHKKEKKLVIDHDHESGQVRGLLCNSCNKALGFMKDNEDIASAMILYIRKNR